MVISAVVRCLYDGKFLFEELKKRMLIIPVLGIVFLFSFFVEKKKQKSDPKKITSFFRGGALRSICAW
jgi:hypothetical protein